MVIGRIFYSAFFALAFSGCFLFSVGVVFAHGGEEHATLPSEVRVCHALSDAERGACYSAICAGQEVGECLEDIVDAAMVGSGPNFAHAVLSDLVRIAAPSDDDVLAQMVGYTLAQRIGRSLALRYVEGGPTAFMDCGSDFYYGCSYGFFSETLLLRDSTPLDNANAICTSYSSDRVIYEMCIHKMGHMFMKHGDYALTPALTLCDAISPAFQVYCWDGVFMENVNEFFVSDGVRGDGFIIDDPFSPCSTAAAQHREQCYKNHGRYLVDWFEGSPFNVLDVCSDVVDGYAELCRHSVADASSGIESHHTHAGGMGGYEGADSRPWFQRVIDFITSFVTSLFGGYGSEVEEGVEYADETGAYDRSVVDADAPSIVLPDGVLSPDFAYRSIIVYEEGAYVPSEVYITAGERVLWVNQDRVFWPAANLHPTHREYPGSGITKCDTDERSMIFDACEALGPGAAYAFTFNEVGAWQFHDHINPQAVGTVIVE